MRHFSFVALAALYPSIALAVGDEDDLPPTPTPTTTECEDAEIFDEETKRCLPAEDSRLDDDQRYMAVRELAYLGVEDPSNYRRALLILAEMTDSARVQTYYGFIKRKQGDTAAAMVHYRKALALDPANILTRSYMGQAYLADGDRRSAEEQLTKIRALGGADSWAAHSLHAALAGGALSSY